MDVTPQLLHDVEFREAKRGGYNTQDVDEFLERLAIGLERQEKVVQEAQQRVAAAEARAEEAERRAAHAEHAASETTASDETLKRTLVLAQRTADAAIREAEEQAERTLSAAQAEADRLLSETHEAHAQAQAQAEAEARAAHEKARTQVLGEMRDLVAARDRLREDLHLLEQHLEGQRERVRVTVDELQRLLDDPDALYEVDAPELSEASIPLTEEPEEPVWSEAEAAAWVPDDDVWVDALDDEAPDDADVDDPGPRTQPVEVVAEHHPDDDDYLTELRKAMTDDTPLGPRDDIADAGRFDTAVEPERSRFGRRR
ncbi:MAG: DivIVA domain-containing protein [Microthrixaceae bacterium]